MPSITVCSCACGRRVTAARPAASASATGCCGVPAKMRVDLGAPPSELDARDVRIGDLVDGVVDFAAERVQRRDRGAAPRIEQPKAVVEARAALRRLVGAVLVGRHAVRARRASVRSASSAQSRFVSIGRRREHVAADARRSARECACRRRSPRAARGPRASGRRRGSAAPRVEQRARARRFERHQSRPARDRALPAAIAARRRRSARDPPAECRRGPCASRCATSCQKLASCSAVQIASLSAHASLRRRRRYSASSRRPTGLAERRQ